MIAADGTPHVLEFNCRFGDPETQPILSAHAHRSHAAVRRCAGRPARNEPCDWDPRAALGVVLAAGGYPDSVRKGDVIHGLEDAAAVPAKSSTRGTAPMPARIVTDGGRVLCAVGLGDSVLAAQQQAYELVRAVHWPEMQYRKDIGYRAIERERETVTRR